MIFAVCWEASPPGGLLDVDLRGRSLSQPTSTTYALNDGRERGGLCTRWAFRSGTVLDPQEHFIDIGGASDHIVGLFALIGKRFSPRLRDLKDRKFHTFEKSDAYPTLSHHLGAPINTAPILDHRDDLLHLAASITTRSVVPYTILKKLSASPKQSHLARALRELGRIERSLFMIE